VALALASNSSGLRLGLDASASSHRSVINVLLEDTGLGLGLEENWPWPWPRRLLTLALALASNMLSSNPSLPYRGVEYRWDI